MSTTKLRGSAQIQSDTIPIGGLVSNFLNGVNWNITNGNNNATITGIKDPVNNNDAANKEYVDNMSKNIDGGAPDSIYLISQYIDGGTP